MLVYSFESEVALRWSIKKETCLGNNGIRSTYYKTAVLGFEYFFVIRHIDGFAAITFYDTNGWSEIKELTLSIPSANFKADFSKRPDVPKDHVFYGWNAVVIKSEDILNPEKNFFVNDILTLEFGGKIEWYRAPNPLCEMLWKGDDKDFTFIIGEREIKAHKFILRRYSSVFTEMFNSNTDQIKINDFKYSTIRNALLFCYDIPIRCPAVHSLLEILRFAVVYDMPIIKERILSELAKKINAKNVCKIANKSIEFNATTLKGYCICFISKCQRDGKQYDDALNLNIEIVHELYKSSLFQTHTS